MSEELDVLFFEKVLIRYLLIDQDIRDKVWPYLDPEIFDNFECQKIVKELDEHNVKFHQFPTVKELKLRIDNPEVHKAVDDIVHLDISDYKKEFLLDQIEQFVQSKLAYHELSTAVEKLQEGKIKDLNSVSDKLRTAVNFSFDTDIGFNLFSPDGAEKMYEFYHSEEVVLPTKIKSFDRLIGGGLHRSSTLVFLAQSNMGKTLLKCALAANLITQNYKVTFITLELTEQYIGDRIVKNVLDIEDEDIYLLTKEQFIKKYNKVCEKVHDLLVIKKYPSGTVNTNHLRNLLNELEIKKKFKTDVLIVDYLGILAAAGVNKNANSNDKGIVKVQELNALAEERDIPIVSSAQANRSGYGSSVLDPTNIADSIGIFAEAYVVVSVTQTEEQRHLPVPIFLWRVLKNRFGINLTDTTVGVNYNKMRLINLDDDQEVNSEQTRQIEQEVEEASQEIFSSLSKTKKDRKKRVIDFQ